MIKPHITGIVESTVTGRSKWSAEECIDVATTDWDEEERMLEAIHKDTYGDKPCGFMAAVNEATDIAQIMWKRLPGRLRGSVDLKKLKLFVEFLEDGSNLESAARSSKIPTAVAVELMTAIERMGLL